MTCTKQGLDDSGGISTVIPKLDFFQVTCQLISDEVLAVLVKVFILKGIKISLGDS